MVKKNQTYHSSEHKKSLQSAKSMSLTPGWRTMELMGRFWRAPFQRQTPYVLKKKRGDDERSFDRINRIYGLRISHIYMDTVLGIFFIFAFSF